MMKIVKAVIIIVGLPIILLIGRYAFVQNSIKNIPLEMSEYAATGFTPKDVYGHGDLITQTAQYGWYVYDIADAKHGVKKMCVFGIEPEELWDIDFVYAKDEWYKLRSGTGIITSDGFTSEPKTQKWKNLITTQLAFPVRDPDLPYKLKIFFSKIKSGSQSPLEYLQILKATNPNCTKMPSP